MGDGRHVMKQAVACFALALLASLALAAALQPSGDEAGASAAAGALGVMKLEAMETSLLAVAKEGSTPELLPFIDEIKNLTSAMKADVEKQANTSQAVLDTSWEDFKSCFKNYTPSFDNLITLNNTHRDCSVLENRYAHTYFDEKDNCDILNATRVAKCHQLLLVDEYPPLGFCHLDDPVLVDSSRPHYVALENHFSDTYADWNEKNIACTTAETNAENCYLALGSFFDQWMGKAAECTQHQSDLEAHACQDNTSECDGYRTCYFTKKAAWESTNTTVAAEEFAFTAEYRGLLRMECLLDALENSIHNDNYRWNRTEPYALADALKVCQNTSFWTSEYLGELYIHYYDISENPLKACSSGVDDPGLQPGSQFWIQSMYSDMPSYTTYEACDASCCVTGQVDAQSPLCTCDTPNAGTSGRNQYSCLGGSSGSCAEDEACYASGNFTQGDLENACEVAILVNADACQNSTSSEYFQDYKSGPLSLAACAQLCRDAVWCHGFTVGRGGETWCQLCKATACTCTSPNAGTAYTCDDSSSGHCTEAETCYATGQFPKKDLKSGCKATVSQMHERRWMKEGEGDEDADSEFDESDIIAQ